MCEEVKYIEENSEIIYNNLMKKLNSITIVTLVLIIFSTALYGIAYSQVNAVAEQRCWQSLKEASASAAVALAQHSQINIRTLETIAVDMSGQESLTSPETAKLLGDYAQIYPFAEVGIFLPDGKVLTSGGELVDAPKDMEYKELSPESCSFSYKEESLIPGSYVARYYAPIARNKALKGYLFFGLSRRDLTSEIELRPYDEVRDFYLVSKETGDFFVDTRTSELNNISDYQQPGGKEGFILYKQWEAGSSGRDTCAIYRIPKTGEEIYYYQTPVGIGDWEVAVGISKDVAFGNLMHFHMIFISLGIAEILALVIYYIWINLRNRAVLEKALLAEKAKKEESSSHRKLSFLSSLSHDIRTPLNAIIGFTMLARNNMDDRERLADYLGKISNSGAHLGELVNEVLNMSQIETGQIIPDIVPINLPIFAKEISTAFASKLKVKKINFTVKLLSVSAENVYGDREHMEQVLSNVINNALKFTPMGGSVDMTIEQETDREDGMNMYSFYISDTGIGIAEDQLPHIFDPLERGVSPYAREANAGTGLGLTIARSITEFMGGTISVESQRGKGSTFTIKLSLQAISDPEDIKRAQENTPRGDYMDFIGKRVLLVEDNDLNMEIAQEFLEDWGIQVENAENGAVALKMLRNAGPGYYDLVLMDVIMPVMDGLEATVMIRNLPDRELAAIPIVAMTANALEPDKQMVMEAGMNAYIIKPINVKKLEETLAKFLRKNTVSI